MLKGGRGKLLQKVVVSIYFVSGCSSTINFSKAEPYGREYIKIELINQEKLNGRNFPLKCLELILVTLCLITPIGQKKVKV